MCSNVLPLSKTACSGKCRAGGCASAPRVWVVAACEGFITLLSKMPAGELQLQPLEDRHVFASLEEFHRYMERAQAAHRFDQLIVIGSASDIAWVHSSLPQHVSRLITAEIKYPLMTHWFKETPPLPHLTQALSTVLAG